jgi:hypothetical protein
VTQTIVRTNVLLPYLPLNSSEKGNL